MNELLDSDYWDELFTWFRLSRWTTLLDYWDELLDLGYLDELLDSKYWDELLDSYLGYLDELLDSKYWDENLIHIIEMNPLIQIIEIELMYLDYCDKLLDSHLRWTTWSTLLGWTPCYRLLRWTPLFDLNELLDDNYWDELLDLE